MTTSAPKPRTHHMLDEAAVDDDDAPISQRTRRGTGTAGAQPSSAQISAWSFYAEYHSHKIEHLDAILPGLRQTPERAVVWLLGDSTLDNKYWLGSHKSIARPACNGFEHVLSPAKSVPDCAYWVNRELLARGQTGAVCVNTSVEESTLQDREGDGLLPQDVFCRDSLSERDTLVVSVGGNDVALRPTAATVVNMLMLTRSPMALIRSGCAPGTGYFVRLFRDATIAFLRKVIAQTKPRRIVLCMLYYLDETPGGSWADRTLGVLGYDKNPEVLQLIMRTLYERISSSITTVDGVPVVPCPLFRALDGKTTADYAQRVEPSIQGGEKLAKVIVDAVFAESAAATPWAREAAAADH